jgi:D-psicose/D-tagatose/L-ribulose 3-epimerase
LQGGTIGREIKVWRDLSDNADEAQLDQEAKKALEFSRYVIGKR